MVKLAENNDHNIDPQEPRISSVPTLVKWGSSKRLGDDHCNDESMVEMFFEED
jgi:hypothetical protein